MDKTTNLQGEPAKPQPARQSNLDAIVSYFESGIKTVHAPHALGIELEHIVLNNNMTPVGYSDEHGVAWLLHQLSGAYPRVTQDDRGDILGVSRPGEAITIEPAAQVELSAGPFTSLKEADACFTAFEDDVNAILAPYNKRIVPVGYNPTAKARTLELIPKRRYQFMNMYLSERDTDGPCMMRGSASTQISIDYTSVADCLRKIRIAFALVPLLSLICDNTPIYEGEKRTHHMMRTSMWEHVDPDRCGLVAGALDPDFTLRKYAEYVLDTPAILVPCTQNQWCYDDRTFGEIYAERTMTHAEVEHALSMLFTDVRLKTYLEIRPADSMPIPYVIAYAALIKGLFYTPANLDALEALFADVDKDAFVAAKDALMQKGYEAIVYGTPAPELCDTIISLAQAGLTEDEKGYLEPLAKLVQQRKTLAETSEFNK